MTPLERLLAAWEKASQGERTQFLTFLDQWQAMHRERLEREKQERRS